MGREKERKEWEQERDGHMDRQTVAGMGRKRQKRGIGEGRRFGATDSSRDKYNYTREIPLPIERATECSRQGEGKTEERWGEEGWIDRSTDSSRDGEGKRVDRQIDRQKRDGEGKTERDGEGKTEERWGGQEGG